MAAYRVNPEDDIRFMTEALTLARAAGNAGDVPVGAVVVRNGEIVGRGLNRRENGGSATGHAEIVAIDEACRTLGGWRLTDCTLYVTLEPCPMCAGAVFSARLGRLVFGAHDTAGGALGGSFNLRDSVSGWCTDICGGVLGNECSELIGDFFSRKRSENRSNKPSRLKRDFFTRPAQTVAHGLLGKIICRRDPETNETHRLRITETECYCGTDDTACHASKGKTDRNRVMWSRGGTVYVYLCYGMHNMLNIVTGEKDDPQAVLIRGAGEYDGPGKLTRALGITRSLNGSDVCLSDVIWIEDDGYSAAEYDALKRVGIDYASAEDRERLWRYRTKQ